MIVCWVHADGSGCVSEISREALTMARQLAAAGGGVPIDAVHVGEVPGGSVERLSDSLAEYGVRRLYLARGEGFAAFSGAAWGAAVLAARAAAGAVVVMAGGDPRDLEVMAHAAARAQVPYAANVVGFEGLAPFVVRRQVVGGTVTEWMRLSARPAIFSVAGHCLEATPAPERGPAEVVPLEVALTPADTVAAVRSTVPRETNAAGDLASARVVVGAGRGAGGPDGFEAVSELASRLGGQLGVSRVVTSLGWRPHHEQVGQTGTRISPEVYIPCGISGAIQHWAGCASSKVIIAINTDPEAPMMTKATYAVVGDMHEVVPAILEELGR